MGRYRVAETQTCNMQPPRMRMVPWKPQLSAKCLIRTGRMKLPAAVPDTQMPFARARCLSKYWDTITMPGVVERPPPIPKRTLKIKLCINFQRLPPHL